jgi:hypothetical protein
MAHLGSSYGHNGKKRAGGHGMVVSNRPRPKKKVRPNNAAGGPKAKFKVAPLTRADIQEVDDSGVNTVDNMNLLDALIVLSRNQVPVPFLLFLLSSTNLLSIIIVSFCFILSPSSYCSGKLVRHVRTSHQDWQGKWFYDGENVNSSQI